MATNPSEIVEKQLLMLKDISDRTSLTFEEIASLERLIRIQILLRMKSTKDISLEECGDISTEELKSLLPLLDSSKGDTDV